MGSKFYLGLASIRKTRTLVLIFPDHGMLITQDLVYDHVHAFVGEKTFDTWTRALETYRELGYSKILPGRGAPGGPELYE